MVAMCGSGPRRRDAVNGMIKPLMILFKKKPFPSSHVSRFQSESKCETIMKMTLICMKMNLHAELIFIPKVSYLDSF